MWPIPTGLNGRTDREWREKEMDKESDRRRVGDKRANTKLCGWRDGENIVGVGVGTHKCDQSIFYNILKGVTKVLF